MPENEKGQSAQEKFVAGKEISPEEIEGISLRRATVEDVDDILAVEKSLEGIKTYSPLTDREEAVKEITDSFVYLIEQNSRVVGDISYEIRDKNHAYISGLAIMPDFQRQGIGRKALEMVLEDLKDFEVIDLVTHPDNKSIGLYKSFGFKEAGEKIENYFGDGESRIRMVLEKEKQ